jgi:hypothetical protein
MNVPPSQSQNIYQGFLSAGMNPSQIALDTLSGLTHDEGVIPWGINTMNWFNQLEGK